MIQTSVKKKFVSTVGSTTLTCEDADRGPLSFHLSMWMQDPPVPASVLLDEAIECLKELKQYLAEKER